jgi:ABC-type bacteriocin/lantibiotic exporter with double-glycine peptidase domain
VKKKHIDLIAIFLGVILLITVYEMGVVNQNKCQAHSSSISAEQLRNLPESFYIENIPFYDYTMLNTSCMPANLGMVLRFYGSKTTPDELNKQFPELGWSLDNFKQYAKSQGYKVEDYESNIEDLKLKISEGRPVIAGQWLDSYHKWGLWGHVRVVVGYTDKYFITFDPVPEKGKNYNITFSDFAKLWNREPEGGCNRALLVYK